MNAAVASRGAKISGWMEMTNKKGGHWRPPSLNQLGRRIADPMLKMMRLTG